MVGCSQAGVWMRQLLAFLGGKEEDPCPGGNPAEMGQRFSRAAQEELAWLFTGWGVPDQSRGPSMRIPLRASAKKRSLGEGGREQGALWALSNLVPLELQLPDVPGKGLDSIGARGLLWGRAAGSVAS